jgi:hypothetical protein
MGDEIAPKTPKKSFKILKGLGLIICNGDGRPVFPFSRENGRREEHAPPAAIIQASW